jgi:hypothetical protein
MPIMSFDTFKTKTSKWFSLRNGAIGAIDTALKAYHKAPDSGTLATLKKAVDDFKDEKNQKFGGTGGDYTNSKRESQGGITELSSQVDAELKPKGIALVGLSVGRGNLRQVTQGPVSSYSAGQATRIGKNTRRDGWAYEAFDPTVWTWTTAVTSNAQDELTKAQETRITESLRRAKAAVSYAHTAVVDLAKLTRFSSPPTLFESIYIDYFGAFDAGRIAKVKRNFTILKLALDRGPTIIDLRDTTYGLSCYAACFRGNLGVSNSSGQVSVGSALKVFLGRSFFATGVMNYGASTDSTVGTLIHEFAHGAINAVDVPPVSATGAWTHARKSDDPAHNDFGDSTDNSVQASTIPLDKLLAKHQPDYAVVNADNYGQFACALLTHYGA